MQLLSRQASNTKLAKNTERTWGLSLAPASSSGWNVCPHSTAGCRAACVAHSGMSSVFPSINRARAAKTAFFFQDRPGFLAQLRRELTNADKSCCRDGVVGYVRLNVFSDIAWERMLNLGSYPHLRFYDYTKSMPRALAQIGSDVYRLAYSINEESDDAAVAGLLAAGGIASMVLSVRYVNAGNLDPTPESVTVAGAQFVVIDGDKHDNRFTQPPGTVAGLRLKGSLKMRATAVASGFARPVTLTVGGQATTAA